MCVWSSEWVVRGLAVALVFLLVTQPNTTTMDTQHSMPSDRDENMTEENPAAFQGRRFDPHPELATTKPDDWHERSKNAKEHWRRAQRRRGKG